MTRYIAPGFRRFQHGLSVPDLPRRAKDSIQAVIAAGIEAYDRHRHLPRLIPVGPAEVNDERPEARKAILARLARALRGERNRGRAGHWTYDLNRHIALKQAYAAERQMLTEQRSTSEATAPRG
jgi:hypothetical protein